MPEQETAIREELTVGQHVSDAHLTIDLGFVNVRNAMTVLGTAGMEAIDHQIRALSDLPEWQRSVCLAHIYTRTLLNSCEHVGVLPWGALLARSRSLEPSECLKRNTPAVSRRYRITLATDRALTYAHNNRLSPQQHHSPQQCSSINKHAPSNEHVRSCMSEPCLIPTKTASLSRR